MKISKKKVGQYFRKIITGTKSGVKEAGKFLDTYGPATHNRFNRMASGIQETFEVHPGPHAPKVDFSTRPMGNFRPLRKMKRKRPSRVDWEGLGMR